jgi:inosine-uridine nucleoside N-ribohydrolase
MSATVTDIILDCDPGHDDAIALLLALASPDLRLLGVTTVSGNQTLEKTTANAIRVLDHSDRLDIPVAAGADRPLVRERDVAAEVHGETGLDGPNLPPPSRPPEPAHAIDWIAMTLSASPNPVTLVPTGPLTNIALFLARYPELTDRIERIVLMGGAIGEGNATPSAEFNIWADPAAACSRADSTSRWSGSTSPIGRCSVRSTSSVCGVPARRGSSSPICSSSTPATTAGITGGKARRSTTRSRWRT